MESKIAQLVEMGSTRAQAKAALTRYKDVDQAAEKIFEGYFDNLGDEDLDAGSGVGSTTGSELPVVNGSKKQAVQRPITPDDHIVSDDDLEALQDDEDEDEDDYADFADYDSDIEAKRTALKTGSIDPYAGIFFSKDRREEVIEVEEIPDLVYAPSLKRDIPLMTQGDFMKGCSEGGEQGFLFSLYTHLSSGSCPCPFGCGEKVIRKKSDFFSLYPQFSMYIQHVREVVQQTCPKCHKEFCLACSEARQISNTGTTKSITNGSGKTHDILLHCSDLQGVILGVGLYMLDQLFEEQSDPRPRPRVEAPSVSKRRKVYHFELDPEIVSTYRKPGKSAPGGTGYAGNHKEDHTGEQEALAMQRTKDERMSELFRGIREYLPSLRRPGGSCASDYLVHPTTLAHLRRRFNHVCSTLLRNDSLTDMSDRSVLYYELFEWLATISNHEALASMMGMPIMVVISRKQRNAAVSKGSPRPAEVTVMYEGSAGPRELLESIVVQAIAAIKGLDSTTSKDDGRDKEMTEEEKRRTSNTKGKGKSIAPGFDENQRLLQFCRKILDTRDAIDRALLETKGQAFMKRLNEALPKVPGSSGDDGSALAPIPIDAKDEDIKQAYVEWATRVRFEYCDLSVPVETTDRPKEPNGEQPTVKWKFFYSDDARLLINSDLPRRSLAIAKELAILTTNLPVAWNSSIFLRVDETRVDIIKALIIGPEGTPYHNGCYLFDIFLGASYNQTPPSVKYLTTNGGKFRFNPNLYADGKVCLSLLGTWNGPGWVAGKSTLLQVLISIQSMILCEEPYLNEPGWANASGTAASKSYSANVRRMVVHTAMLGNLREPPEPFGDVIRTHFKLKAKEINQQLDQWLQTDDKAATSADYGTAGSSRNEGSNFANNIEMLKEMIRNL